MKPKCVSLSYNWKKECPGLSSFLYCLLKTKKLLHQCVICNFHYLKKAFWIIYSKNISARRFFVNLDIFYNENVYLFQLVAFKIVAIMKTVYWFSWLPWTSTGSSYWEMFLEIDLNQKTFTFYTSWVHWKILCRSAVTKHALLWNKYEYQHSADIFVKYL